MIRYIILLTIFSNLAYADGASYGGRHEIAIDGWNGSFRHVHNWGSKKNREIFFDLANHDKIFTTENDFSYVEFIDRNGKVLFHAPSPAFTKLWTYRDSYFVGISNIKLNNPYQIVVWGGDGRIIYKAHFTSEVAKFTPEQLNEFKEKFPKTDELLKTRFFSYNNITYCDCVFLNVLDKDAWDYLFKLRVKHPYVYSTETVSNFVDWYKHGAEPEVDGSRENLIISIGRGGPIVIPLGKSTQLLRPVGPSIKSK